MKMVMAISMLLASSSATIAQDANVYVYPQGEGVISRLFRMQQESERVRRQEEAHKEQMRYLEAQRRYLDAKTRAIQKRTHGATEAE